MSCDSGFTAYFPQPTAAGRREMTLLFLYHGIGPVDWCATIEFFELPPTNAPMMLPEWDAVVPLVRLIDYIGPLTLPDFLERHHFFRFQYESQRQPGREGWYSRVQAVLDFLAEIDRGNIPEKVKVFVMDMG